MVLNLWCLKKRLNCRKKFNNFYRILQCKDAYNYCVSSNLIHIRIFPLQVSSSRDHSFYSSHPKIIVVLVDNMQQCEFHTKQTEETSRWSLFFFFHFISWQFPWNFLKTWLYSCHKSQTCELSCSEDSLKVLVIFLDKNLASLKPNE